MNTIEAAGITTADIEDCPIQIIAEQMKGIQDDIADLLVYCKRQLEESLERDQIIDDNAEAKHDHEIDMDSRRDFESESGARE